ncbi:MAG: GTPase Era [Bryobacteraceae bacterium]|nr:GTPase Era [Bryobacteraceae bacterium]
MRPRKKPSPGKQHRSGFVSILGRPNTGKSTLLNALVGVKLAIVANKPQTTRTTIQGVWTTDHAQVVFIDTPGIHSGDSKINRRMMDSIRQALDHRDLLLFVIDASREPGAEDARALELVKQAGAPAIAVFNKIDLVKDKRALLPLMDRYRQLHGFTDLVPVSARKGDGLDTLRNAIIERLPPGPAYFPKDHLTDQPERFLVSEIIREKILAVTRDEVPHAVAVTVDEWKEEGRLTRVAATIHVERPGQRAILLGERGERLKSIGTKARLECEALLGRRFFLGLFVRVSKDWRESDAFLRDLDWRTA